VNHVIAHRGTPRAPPTTAWQRMVQIFIVLMPFLHALSIGTWGPLPLVFAAATLLLGMMAGAHHWMWLQKSDLLLLGMIACGVLAIAMNSEYAGPKNFNHTVALIVTITVFYLWMRAWLLSSQISLEQIGAAATLSLLIAAFAVVFEFWSANGPGFYLADFLPYPTDDMSNALVLDEYKRPRGLSAEPGFTAMVFEALAPLAYIYLRNRRQLALTVLPIVLLGFALTFSAGGFSSLLVAALLLASVGRGTAFKVLILVLAVAGGLLFVFGSDAIAEIGTQIVGRKIVGLFVQSDVDIGDATGRYEAYRAGFEMFDAYPGGIGWGMVSQMFDSGRALPGVPLLTSRGLLSFYLEILVSAGFVGLILFAIFHGLKILQLVRTRVPHAPVVLFGLLTLSLHHAFVLEFWFPMLWFYFSLSDVMYARDARRRALARTEPVRAG
jgi:hypothetical protein